MVDVMGVGATFNRGAAGILGAHRGPKTAERAPHEGPLVTIIWPVSTVHFSGPPPPPFN